MWTQNEGKESSWFKSYKWPTDLPDVLAAIDYDAFLQPFFMSTDEDNEDKAIKKANERPWKRHIRRDRTPAAQAVLNMLDQADKARNKNRYSVHPTIPSYTATSASSMEASRVFLEKAVELKWAYTLNPAEYQTEVEVIDTTDISAMQLAGAMQAAILMSIICMLVMFTSRVKALR